MLKKALIILSCFTLLGISACGQKEYFEAVKEQNVTIQSMNMANEARREREEQRHQERMLTLMQTSMQAAASTKDKTDDVLVPLLIMSMEDKRIMAKALTAGNEKSMQLQTIKAPDSFGDSVKKSTGALLGIGGIIMGITQSNNMADIAAAGMNAAGVHNTVTGDNNAITSDSYKNGSNNTVSGENNTITGKSCPDCDKEESTYTDDRPDNWEEVCTPEFLATIPGNCSGCDSYYAGRCSIKP